ncbi:DNA-binding NarL/FixJ family response regulator [Filimonas zeae]|nr:response regulator transcription factor [Filimonas zeae]MDR6338132.1 DNA-binding NarL/FixJ family response regulator [Filimonas zeae]
MTRILIYEDNSELREVLSILIGGMPNYHLVGAYGHCTNIVEEVKRTMPDLILMDINMPAMSGIEGLKLIRENGFQTKVLMLTVFDDNQNVFQAIKSGANGYILKKTPPARLMEYLEDALNGGAPMTSSIATQVLNMIAGKPTGNTESFNLSAREKEVLNLLVEGFSYKLIADKLFISMDTVRSHIKKIYEKLHVNSKSEAVAKTLRANQ